MFKKHQTVEYPPTPIEMLKQIRTRFGEEGVTLVPNPAAHLQDRDRRVIELETTGYTLLGTFVLPQQAASLDTTIGNIHVIPKTEALIAAHAILQTLARQRIEAAMEEFGAQNVAICRTMRFLPEAEDAYGPHEYMALYARNTSPQILSGS